MGWTRKSRERNTPQVSEDTFKLTTLTSGFHLFCIPLSCPLHALNVCVDFARLLASKTELCSPPLASSTLGSTSSKGELRFVPSLYVPAYSIPSAPCSSGTFVADDLSLLECSQRYKKIGGIQSPVESAQATPSCLKDSRRRDNTLYLNFAFYQHGELIGFPEKHPVRDTVKVSLQHDAHTAQLGCLWRGLYDRSSTAGYPK